jgi:hypothetical protein
VFENRVLRRIFGAKRDEITGDCTQLQNDELHNLLYYNYQVKDDEMGRACSRYGRDEGCIETFDRKT